MFSNFVLGNICNHTWYKVWITVNTVRTKSLLLIQMILSNLSIVGNLHRLRKLSNTCIVFLFSKQLGTKTNKSTTSIQRNDEKTNQWNSCLRPCLRYCLWLWWLCARTYTYRYHTSSFFFQHLITPVSMNLLTRTLTWWSSLSKIHFLICWLEGRKY